jgi:DNA (cytosine-5)-methyltransferase 1
MNKPIKIVDLFAGPGGLGEGFSSVVSGSSPAFKIVASVEKEASAHKTLTLRAFVRQFKKQDIPREYYRYI